MLNYLIRNDVKWRVTEKPIDTKIIRTELINFYNKVLRPNK